MFWHSPLALLVMKGLTQHPVNPSQYESLLWLKLATSTVPQPTDCRKEVLGSPAWIQWCILKPLLGAPSALPQEPVSPWRPSWSSGAVVVAPLHSPACPQGKQHSRTPALWLTSTLLRWVQRKEMQGFAFSPGGEINRPGLFFPASDAEREEEKGLLEAPFFIGERVSN